MRKICQKQLTLFAVDSPAKIYPARGSKRDLEVKGRRYTSKCLGLLASVCPDTQFLKTYRTCLPGMEGGGLRSFSMTWPRSGMMRSGIVYQLQALVPTTKGTECGLLPTPRKMEIRDSRSHIIERTKKGRKGPSSLTSYLIYLEGGDLFAGGKIVNPTFAELLMGFPVGWTDLQD